MSCPQPHYLSNECVRVGDSTDIIYVRATSGVTPDDSTCRQSVRLKNPQPDNDPVIGPLDVTDTTTLSDGFKYFMVYLTPEQTATLTAGTVYLWTVEIVGDEDVFPPLTEERDMLLTVSQEEIPVA